ncbi:PspA/IM30 family protein [Ascidiaceihabitans sp.]|uniref:PspA/IM30 family protein n=1 Tax=Ascidiaceihabitans sp. TaxID=1872644 RepID=UPI003299A80E
MFGTLKTLMIGANARAEEHVRQVYSIELIEQKIREAQDGLKSAKYALAGLIQRARSEERLIATLTTRVTDLMTRAGEAMAAGREDMAAQAAQAVADMENEIDVRRETLSRLESRILRLRASVETANRRIIDLKQGAIAAKAVKREHDVQSRLGRTLTQDSAIDQADALIKSVLGRDDPLEQREILNEIDQDLSHEGVADRMAAAGFGTASKTTAADVLKRFSAT